MRTYLVHPDSHFVKFSVWMLLYAGTTMPTTTTGTVALRTTLERCGKQLTILYFFYFFWIMQDTGGVCVFLEPDQYLSGTFRFKHRTAG